MKTRKILNITKEQAEQDFWHRGNLSFKFHAAQRIIDKRFKESSNQLFVGNCSRQFGKSFWAVAKAVEQAIKHPKSQIRYGAAFQSDLVDFIIPAFDKIMEDCPAKIKGKYKTSGNRYVFPNGSIIKLVGLDKNPDGLRGSTLDLVILDECGFVSGLDYIFKSILIPATTHRPDCKIVMISTPAATPAHPFMDFALRAELEGGYAKFTIYDNPMVDEATVQRLMKESGGETSTTWRREFLCEFCTESDLAVIPEWKDEYAQDIKRDELHLYYHKYVGMDLGVKDFTACIFGYYDFRKAALVIEDELTLNGPSLNTQILAGAIKNTEHKLWDESKVYRRISDNNNLHLLQDLASLHELPFIATSKESLVAMINELRLYVQSGRIIINPRCKKTIGCLKYGVWNQKKTEFARSSAFGHFDHLAALIYLVRNLNPNDNPIPAEYGFTPSTWNRNAQTQDKSNHQAIINIFKPQKFKRN